MEITHLKTKYPSICNLKRIWTKYVFTLLDILAPKIRHWPTLLSTFRLFRPFVPSILEAREFEWESQLRFYWEKDSDQLLVQQCTGKFGFGYEYMGLNGRLVITSLTDRIYLTITQALSMHLGGAPAGPAGTGKTETVKDLAKAMGLLCVVTNCGEGMDYKVSHTEL